MEVEHVTEELQQGGVFPEERRQGQERQCRVLQESVFPVVLASKRFVLFDSLAVMEIEGQRRELLRLYHERSECKLFSQRQVPRSIVLPRDVHRVTTVVIIHPSQVSN